MLEFVRGGREWHALVALGGSIVLSPNGAEIDTPATVPTVEASPEDVVAGLSSISTTERHNGRA